MAHRLVLGCGGLGRRIIQRLIDRSDRLQAVVEPGDGQSWFSNQNVDITAGDPSDPLVLSEIESSPDSVLVAAADPDRIQRIAAAARIAFREQPVRALVPLGNRTLRSELPEDVEPIDPDRILADHVLDIVAGETGNRVQRFRSTLQSLDGPLAVIMHDNPDPDAIASGVAVATLATAVGTDAQPCYFGDINHHENRALVNLLELDLEELDPETGIEAFDAVALVDHSRPGVNNQLPEDTEIDIVIDHHPPNGPVNARYVDLRINAGATSSILVEYFPRLGREFDEAIATALLYGIRVDTDDFTREVATPDFEAAATLTKHADASILERVESPNISADTFDTLSRAIRNRQVDGSIVTSCVGSLSDRDTLAQAADRLLQLDGIDTTFVYGIHDDTVYASARARGDDIDLGATLRSAFQQIGSAGGHAQMAGAQIPIGMLAESDDKEALESAVEGVIRERFFDELDLHRPISDHPYTTSNAELSFLSIPDGMDDDPFRASGEDGGGERTNIPRNGDHTSEADEEKPEEEPSTRDEPAS